MIELQRKSQGNKFSMFLLLIGGAVMFVENLYARLGGLLVIVLGLISIYARSGTQIDMDKRLWRKYVKLAWFYFGTWTPLPQVDYVAIIRMRLSQLKFKPSQAGFTQEDGGYQHNYNINLIFKDSALRYLTIYTGELDDTLEKSRQMALTFQTKLYDCSTSRKHWIELDELKKK
ncbi:hypothetical protein LX69_02871 [Breznakibacter xylanolyticus]|uniref:Uncharacterized protein n=1 Tax=Breznakibacter xylanolyticus TaxID=990 RepID=A0A2W7NM66_9BACT|nr:hypothetical protein [Breznakibacter xylanolyticus]PZX12402.1 hypothetical protein LX69_02871 [Breznakibacter xylanolyticus]